MTDAAAQGPTPVAPVYAARTELLAGALLVGITLVGAVVLRIHPRPLFLDRWGLRWIRPAEGDVLYERVADLHSTTFVVVGSVLAALVVAARDRRTALACLVGPGLAVFLAEWILKPLVARRYADVLTYPSGTTTAIAGVAAAWVVAVPHRIRAAAGVVGAIVVGLECIAVVALQWHYPTDALAGAALGIGVVLVLDGGLHVTRPPHRSRAGAGTGPLPGTSGTTG